MRVVSTIASILAALFITLPGSATAQEPDSEGSAETPSGDGRDEEARMLFEAGQTAFDEGRFSNALDYFEQAYLLSGRAELLYNVGVSAERLRNDERALSALRQYLEEAPDVENRRNIEARIAILEEGQAESPSPTTDSGIGAGPWILAGAGAVFVIAGSALVATAISHRNRVENSEAGSMWSDVESSADKVGPFSGIGFAALGLGAGMVTGGLLWWALGRDSGDEDRPQVAIGVGHISVQGSF